MFAGERERGGRALLFCRWTRRDGETSLGFVDLWKEFGRD